MSLFYNHITTLLLSTESFILNGLPVTFKIQKVMIYKAHWEYIASLTDDKWFDEALKTKSGKRYICHWWIWQVDRVLVSSCFSIILLLIGFHTNDTISLLLLHLALTTLLCFAAIDSLLSYVLILLSLHFLLNHLLYATHLPHLFWCCWYYAILLLLYCTTLLSCLIHPPIAVLSSHNFFSALSSALLATSLQHGAHCYDYSNHVSSFP